MRAIRAKSRLVRSVVLALTVLAVLGYVCVGHGLHAPNDGMQSMHGEGICLVIFALAAAFALRVAVKRLPLAPPFGVVALAQPGPLPVPRVPRVGARASPIWLQRFLR